MKLPRKLKKRLLGYKKTKSVLKRMIKNSYIVGNIVTMYERPKIEPYGMFCPKCGCVHYYGGGNMVGYPEHYEYFYCLRCKGIVATIDNSPFIHELELILINN